jgi:hypothetical protein
VAGVHDPAIFGSRLARVAAPGATNRLKQSFGAGAAEVRALLGTGQGVLRAAPLGYRLDSFSGTRAAVSVWMVALAGGERLEPVAQWRVLTLDLTWIRGRWLVAAGRGGPGPSPLSQLPVLAAEASTFKEVRHVP